MKMREQEAIENSPDERKTFNGLSKQEKDKRIESYLKEKEKIQAIGFKMIGNGAHSGPISEMHTCQQRPIILTMS